MFHHISTSCVTVPIASCKNSATETGIKHYVVADIRLNVLAFTLRAQMCFNQSYVLLNHA